MNILSEKPKARLLAHAMVKAEYEALAPEFEIAGELLRAQRAGLLEARADGDQPVHDRPT